MKKIKRKQIVMVLIAMLLILVIFSVKIFQKNDKKADTSQKIADISQKTADTSQKTADTSQKIADARRKKLTPSIVQLTCGGLQGSGVIWTVGKDKILIVTNKHVLLQSDTCNVTFWQGEYYSGKVAYLSGEHDIGLVSLKRSDLDQRDVSALKEAAVGRKSPEEIKTGESLYLYGSADYIAGDYLMAELDQVSVYLKDFKDDMMLGSLKKEDTGQEGEMLRDGQLKDGMSGSGVFDQNACLVGLISGGNSSGQFAVVPIWTILQDEKIWNNSDGMQK